MSSAFDLENKVAIVTGGGTGIGCATALEFAKAGADVVVASRNLANLKKVTEGIRAIGKQSIAISADVRRPEDVDNIVSRTIEEFGHIDILVNNAGAAFRAPAENITPNGWNAIIGINLTGVFLCCHAVAKFMIQQRKGRIINISSISGLDGAPDMAHYGAAKAGVINLTRTLAQEWAKYGINVNCIAPGPIQTEAMMATWSVGDETSAAAFAAATSMGRMGQPEEIAYVAIFLASKASSYVTGQTIRVDGGGLGTETRRAISGK